MLQLEGRIAVVFGLANKRSIAWAIAQKLHESGCKLIISYQNDRMKQEALGLMEELPGAEAVQCDVSNDAEIASVFADLKAAAWQAACSGALRCVCSSRGVEK